MCYLKTLSLIISSTFVMVWDTDELTWLQLAAVPPRDKANSIFWKRYRSRGPGVVGLKKSMFNSQQWCFCFGCSPHQMYFAVLVGGKLVRDHVIVTAQGTLGEETAAELMHIHVWETQCFLHFHHTINNRNSIVKNTDCSVRGPGHSKIGGEKRILKNT